MLPYLAHLVPAPILAGVPEAHLNWPATGAFVAIILAAVLVGAALEGLHKAWGVARPHGGDRTVRLTRGHEPAGA